jgi:hypothetical protein
MNALRLVICDWFAPGASSRTEVAVSGRLVIFAVLLVLGYPIVWFLADSAKGELASLLARTLQFLARLADVPIRLWADDSEVFFAITRGRRLEAWLETRPVFANLPILLTLVVVTPGLAWRRRLAYFLGAAGLLLITHLGFLWIKVQVTLISAQHAQAGSPALWQTLDDVFEVTGKTFFPVLIWLLLAFPYMLGALDVTPPQSAQVPSRNAACHCGSGKKYKRCCGDRGAGSKRLTASKDPGNRRRL